MPESSVSTEPQRANPSLLNLPHPVQLLLGYAGFAYVVGFITLVANTARYGVPVFEFVEPINLWVGAVPMFAILAGIALFRKWRESHGLETRFSLLRVAVDIVSVLFPFTVGYGITWLVDTNILYGFAPDDLGGVSPGSLGSQAWTGAGVVSHRYLFEMFGGALLTFLVLRATANWKRLSQERVDYFLRYVITGSTLTVLVLYIWVIYPRMPQRYGFGAPIDVKFVLKTELQSVFARNPAMRSSKPTRNCGPRTRFNCFFALTKNMSSDSDRGLESKRFL